MSDLLDRFHRVLVQEIRKNRPEYLDARFTVAEIYQNLVPYRTHRDAIGVEMNGDYEDALLRLLAGEGDYLMIESDVARREIREELKSSNPNTGLFRDFAAADVRLTSAHENVPEEDEVDGDEGDEEGEDGNDAPTADLADLLAAAEGIEEDGEADGESDGEPDRDSWEASEDESEGEAADEEDLDEPVGEEETVEEPDSDISEDSTPDDAVEGGNADVCQWCRADLPERSVLNYCPFCGSNLQLSPCGECGEELEPGWRFCPGCGTEADT
jgi:double zinc ribbon protein